MRTFAISSIVGILIVSSGCGSGGTPKADVKGRIFLAKGDSEVKIVMGSVTFICADQVAVHAPIQKDGTYTAEKVPLGKARVLVTSQNPAILPKAERGKEDQNKTKPPDSRKKPGEADRNWVPIDPAYSDVMKTPLIYEVVTGANTFDIKLVENPKK